MVVSKDKQVISMYILVLSRTLTENEHELYSAQKEKVQTQTEIATNLINTTLQN